MKATEIVCISALLVGCADLSALGGPTPAEKEQIEASRPICNGEKDCAAKWDAAQLWVVKHASVKIQTATNVIIETYNVSNDLPGMSASVTKEPLGNGQYKIVAHITCAVACEMRPVEAVLDFNRTVASIAP